MRDREEREWAGLQRNEHVCKKEFAQSRSLRVLAMHIRSDASACWRENKLLFEDTGPAGPRQQSKHIKKAVDIKQFTNQDSVGQLISVHSEDGCVECDRKTECLVENNQKSRVQ